MMDVIHKGWLVKEGNTVKSWRTRLFVLTPYRLSYYKDEAQTELAGTIDLIKAFTVERCGVAYHNHNNVFKLHTPGRTYYISAANVDEELQWIQAIRTQVPLYHQPSIVEQSAPNQRSSANASELHIQLAIPDQPIQNQQTTFNERSSMMYDIRWTVTQKPEWATNVSKPQELETPQETTST